jgi:Uncharacterized protein conserved in bacteria
METRKTNIDTLRTLSAILVITVHVCAVFMMDNISTLNSSFIASTSISIYARVCVPVFVAISGRFLLEHYEKGNLKLFYKKRLPRLLMPFVFWSFIYALWKIYVLKAENPYLAFTDFLTGNSYVHLWFFYMLLGLYVITPLLYKLKENLSEKQLRIVTIIFLVVGLVSEFIQGATGHKYFVCFWFFDDIGYFLFGYAFRNFKPKKNYRFLLYFFLSCTIASILLVLVKSHVSGIAWQYFCTGLNPFNIIASMTLYVYFNNLELRSNFLSKVSKYTLGIYVIHMLILETLMNLTNKKITGFVVIDIFVYLALIFGISLVAIFVLYKEKHIRKVIQ